MRLLERNKQNIFYRNLVSSSPITEEDEYGNVLETGEKSKDYGALKSVDAYVKSAIGSNEAEPYGDFTSKRRTIYVENDVCDIDEYSILWVDVDPQADETTGEPTVPHNFTVDGVAKSLNHTRILIRRVEVNLNGSTQD